VNYITCACLALATWVLAGNAGAQTRCPDTGAIVHASDAADAKSACGAVADAQAFLAAQGLDTSPAIEIRFVELMPEIVAGLPVLGCYVRSEQVVYALSFEQCRTRRLPHDIGIDRGFHRALVVHEVAHRIVTANAGREPLSAVAQEYFAYVTMFATMPAAQREQVLQKIPGSGFDATVEIDMTIYLIDPIQFGAQAYRHFLKPGNGRVFLRRVLDRQELIEG
jgi:hypothetical protein